MQQHQSRVATWRYVRLLSCFSVFCLPSLHIIFFKLLWINSQIKVVQASCYRSLLTSKLARCLKQCVECTPACTTYNFTCCSKFNALSLFSVVIDRSCCWASAAAAFNQQPCPVEWCPIGHLWTNWRQCILHPYTLAIVLLIVMCMCVCIHAAIAS